MAPPRVVIVEPDQWPRAMLRAALIEAGYDAIGARSVSSALRAARSDPTRGDVAAVVIDSDALAAGSEADRRTLRERCPDAGFILLARPTRQAPAGASAKILTRPISVADLVESVRREVPATKM